MYLTCQTSQIHIYSIPFLISASKHLEIEVRCVQYFPSTCMEGCCHFTTATVLESYDPECHSYLSALSLGCVLTEHGFSRPLYPNLLMQIWLSQLSALHSTSWSAS